jgi:hypothetical protein
LGFEFQEKYDIQVFIENQKPEFTYEAIDQVSVEGESSNQRAQSGGTKDEPLMLKRGNDYLEKQRLLRELVNKARELGATAIVGVKYKVYTTAKATGYTFEGTAVRAK